MGSNSDKLWLNKPATTASTNKASVPGKTTLSTGCGATKSSLAVGFSSLAYARMNQDVPTNRRLYTAENEKTVSSSSTHESKGKLTFHPKLHQPKEQHSEQQVKQPSVKALPAGESSKQPRAAKKTAKRKLQMKGSLLDEVCLNHKGKPYLPLSFNKSPEPRRHPVNNAVQQLPMKMFNCAGIGLRTAFSSPALWTQTHFKLIGSNNSESSNRKTNDVDGGAYDDYCYGGAGPTA